MRCDVCGVEAREHVTGECVTCRAAGVADAAAHPERYRGCERPVVMAPVFGLPGPREVLPCGGCVPCRARRAAGMEARP